MKCRHVHKDAPENAVCEDCYSKNKKSKENQLPLYHQGYDEGKEAERKRILELVRKMDLMSDGEFRSLEKEVLKA